MLNCICDCSSNAIVVHFRFTPKRKHREKGENTGKVRNLIFIGVWQLCFSETTCLQQPSYKGKLESTK